MNNLSVIGIGGSASFLGINCPTPVITADSVPELDGWGPDCYWEGKHWVEWFYALKNKYGLLNATTKFSQEWQKRSAFGHELWIANNDVAFRTMVSAEGLNKIVPDLAMIESTGNIGNNAANVVSSAGATVSNLADAIANTANAANTTVSAIDKFVSWLPYLAVAALLVVAYLMFEKKSVNITK